MNLLAIYCAFMAKKYHKAPSNLAVASLPNLTSHQGTPRKRFSVPHFPSTFAYLISNHYLGLYSASLMNTCLTSLPISNPLQVLPTLWTSTFVVFFHRCNFILSVPIFDYIPSFSSSMRGQVSVWFCSLLFF